MLVTDATPDIIVDAGSSMLCTPSATSRTQLRAEVTSFMTRQEATSVGVSGSNRHAPIFPAKVVESSPTNPWQSVSRLIAVGDVEPLVVAVGTSPSARVRIQLRASVAAAFELIQDATSVGVVGSSRHS